MKFVQIETVREWYGGRASLSELTRSIGQRRPDSEFLSQTFDLPPHLQFAIEQIADGSPEGNVAADALDSIPFYSLCRGLFLPLAHLSSERAAQLFGIRVPEPTDLAGKEKLLGKFLDAEVGLTIEEKLGCVLGDLFLGRRSSLRRDSLMNLLASVRMATRTEMLDRLTRVGDVAALFAESRPMVKGTPPLTAAEVLRTLRFLPEQRTTRKFDLLRSLLMRCGRLEAYVLAKLLLRKAGFGFEYRGPLIARKLAERFRATEDSVSHAIALTDVFRVSEVLQREGAAGLRKIQLQPLVPVQPTLAGGATDDIAKFPVWVERKYDGIRLMLHKSTDARGSVLCGAYTRNRGDWLELVPGLDRTIRQVPAPNFILDGELFGTVLDLNGVRPATVYEVYAALQGQPTTPVSIKYAAFDLIYLGGRDLTSHPLSERRKFLTVLLAPLAGTPTSVPLSVSEGQLAATRDDLNRLFHHFRAQGYEGIITKDLASHYKLATRDPEWRKRKPEITLDLAVVGATMGVTTKEAAGMFGSYVIAARLPNGGFQIVGDVAGVDRFRDAEIQREILREGLMTGVRIERPSASGVRPGIGLRPSIVVTVKFEGITRDQGTGDMSLRDPKIAVIRGDKSAAETDLLSSLEELYLRQRVG